MNNAHSVGKSSTYFYCCYHKRTSVILLLMQRLSYSLFQKKIVGSFCADKPKTSLVFILSMRHQFKSLYSHVNFGDVPSPEVSGEHLVKIFTSPGCIGGI